MVERIASRFNARSTGRDVIAGHDLSGMYVVVTGGAGGLGLETARLLLEAGAQVVIASRNMPGKSDRAVLDATYPGSWRHEALDLASFTSIREFAQRWGDARLDRLINNAGVMRVPESRTAEGLETHIGVNHFGHYLLTLLMLPALERAAPARVVQLSSGAHRRWPVEFDDLHFHARPYDAAAAYGQSKTANVLFAVAFTAHFQERGITANAVMPGAILSTGLMRHMRDDELATLRRNVVPITKNTDEGVATTLWAVVAPELERVGGLYLEDCAQAEPAMPGLSGGVMPHALDPALAERLWEISVSTTGVAAVSRATLP